MPSSDRGAPRRILARTLYDGTGAEPRKDVLIEISKGIFTRIAPYRTGEAQQELEEQSIVAPGLIDIQINGANDVQFNDTPTVEGLRRIAQGAERGGTAWILPTFVTAHGRSYLKAMSAARAAIESGVPGILGLHLEGPFLNPARPGIHEKSAIRRADEADIAALTAPFPGPLLLTVAPEQMPAGTIRRLADAGVIVFAGHSEATAADMRTATENGLTGATHLYNAMSQMQAREPGVVGSVLALDRLFAGIIADGHHVHWDTIRVAAALMPDRLCLVTDAMCTLAGTRRDFVFHDEVIRLEGGRLTSTDGTLAGAHIAMDASIRNMIDQGIVSPALAIRLASLNPARALGMEATIGSVATGLAACLTTFDQEWRATGVIRGSQGHSGVGARV